MGRFLEQRVWVGTIKIVGCLTFLFWGISCREDRREPALLVRHEEQALPLRDTLAPVILTNADVVVSKATVIKDSANENLDATPVDSFSLSVLQASGTGRYPVGESVSLVSENHNDSGLCFVGWKVLPQKYGDFLKTFEMDSAHFVMPKDSVIIEALYQSCYEGVESVQIGQLEWMVHNLNVWTQKGSWCYDDESKNCKTYGRLYDFETAENVCTSGWRLPTDEEWTAMMERVGDEEGTRLKAKQGWADDGNASGNGSDTVGFEALPAGFMYETKFMSMGYQAYYWTATEKDSVSAWYRSLSYDNTESSRYYHLKSAGCSVRCVKNISEKPHAGE